MEDGQEFEGYRIVREIGRGAMAVVYEAVQLDLRRKVALKVLHAGFAGDVKAVRRFLREAESAGKLKHPNIVAIHRRGRSAKGVPFIAMDLVEGPSLAELVRHLRGLPPADGRPPVPDDLPGPETPDEERIEVACRIGAQIADALHHAHGQGVSHRDIKPGNVLLQNGQPVVTDFGLAGVLWGGESQLTRTGEVLGTPAYMSPEQARGDETDHRTDVYSLGATLYELIALRQSIDAGSLQDFLHRIPVEEPTPIRKLVPSASRDLETVLARAMAKEPDQRYRTAAALRNDLSSLRSGGPIEARPDGPVRRLVRTAKRRPKTTFGIATAVAALIAAFVLYLAWPEDRTIARLLVRTHDGRTVPVTLVPTDLEGYAEWDRAIALGSTGEWLEVEPGEYWAVIGDDDALAEPLVVLEVGDRLERVVRLVPTARVETEMALVPAGKYAYPRPGTSARPIPFTVKAFLIDKKETSIGEFLRYLQESGRSFGPWKNGPPPVEHHGWPVTQVTWSEAEDYALWVGKRLPTKHEWTAAFLAGTGENLPLGNVGPEALFVDVDEPWPDRSPLGILHLQGNATEWLRSWFVPRGAAPDEPLQRSACRYMGNDIRTVKPRREIPRGSTSYPSLRSPTRGFRCARSVRPLD